MVKLAWWADRLRSLMAWSVSWVWSDWVVACGSVVFVDVGRWIVACGLWVGGGGLLMCWCDCYGCGLWVSEFHGCGSVGCGLWVGGGGLLIHGLL